jgi:hypothetical protein
MSARDRIETDRAMRLFLQPVLLIVFAGAAIAGNPAFDTATICASIYQPVCASKTGETRTFPNACLATNAGFTPVGPGSCDGGRSALPRFCSKQYAPVCGERDGVRRAFGNECEARAEDFAVVRDGSC